MMLTSFSQYYISGRVPLCQSDATLIFGINKEHIDNLKNGKFNTWFPNYNLGINKSGADANTSPFSLPNIVSAFIPLDTTTVYIITRHITMALMGFSAFLLLFYLSFSFPLAILGGGIYMFNPMTYLNHYVGNWTYGYIFLPLGLIFINEWLKNKNRLFLLFSWGLLSGILYLTGGMMVILFTFFSMGLYTIFLSFSNGNDFKGIYSVSVFLISSCFIALAIGAYVFIPEFDISLFKEIRSKNIDTSFFYFSQFSLYRFVNKLMSFIFPFDPAIYFTNYDYGFLLSGQNLPSIIKVFFGNYLTYLNILTLPTILLLVLNWKLIKRETKFQIYLLLFYYLMFLNPFLINPDFLLKIFPFYWFTENYSIYYLVISILTVTAIQEISNGTIKLSNGIKKVTVLFFIFYITIAALFMLSILFYNFANYEFVLKTLAGKFLVYGDNVRIAKLRVLADYLFNSRISIFVLLLFFARAGQLYLFKKYELKYLYIYIFFLCALEYSCYTRLVYPFIEKTSFYYIGERDTDENIFIQNLTPGSRIAYQKKFTNENKENKVIPGKSIFDFTNAELKSFLNENAPFDYLEDYAVPINPNLSFLGTYNFGMEKTYIEYVERWSKGNPLYDKETREKWHYARCCLYSFNEKSPLGRPIFSYLITQNELKDPNLIEVLKGKYYNIYKNKFAIPRAYFVTNTIYSSDISKSMDILESNDFEWAKTAIVYEQKYHLSAHNGYNNQYIVNNLEIFYNDVRVEIENYSPGILILNDLYYPYWSALDNGKPTEIFRVNGIFRGVNLEAGKHIVEMHFHNPKLTLGIWISFLFTPICILLVIYFYKRCEKPIYNVEHWD